MNGLYGRCKVCTRSEWKKKHHPLQIGISVTHSSQSISSSVKQVALAINIRSSHVVSIPLDPLSRVHPGQHLLQELLGITLTRVDTELSDPDGLLEGVVEFGEVVLEVLDLVPRVVVGDDEVDLAAVTASHELLEVIDAFVGLVVAGIGDGG
jgi:hypothetical protein